MVGQWKSSVSWLYHCAIVSYLTSGHGGSHSGGRDEQVYVNLASLVYIASARLARLHSNTYSKSNNNKITIGQELSVMAYLLSSDTLEAKVGRLWVGGQPGLCRKIWSQQNNRTMLPPGEMSKSYASFLWIFSYKCTPYEIISKWKPDLEKNNPNFI